MGISKIKDRHQNFKFCIIILIFAFCVLSFTTGCHTSKEKAAYYCPMHPTYTSDRPGDCPICNMKLIEAKAKTMSHAAQPVSEISSEEVCVQHDCTMKDCNMRVITGLKPGERVICPICGEYITTTAGKLVKITAPHTGPTGPTVMISPERQQLIGVTTGPVSKRELAKTVKASGRIAYDPELAVTQEEFVRALDNEDKMKDSPLRDAQDRARSLSEAARGKLRLLGMGEEEIAALEKTRKAQTGLYLPGKGENVWAYISIYEYELGLVKPGAAVEMEAVAYPGETFYGSVTAVSPVLDPATRTNQVRVEVANRDDKLKPEMFVDARIKISLGEKLSLPESAVLDTGVRKIVYISREGGVLELREVRLGRKADGYYEVLGGVEEGDIVVTSGNFLIDSESRLKSATAGETGHQHGQ